MKIDWVYSLFCLFSGILLVGEDRNERICDYDVNLVSTNLGEKTNSDLLFAFPFVLHRINISEIDTKESSFVNASVFQYRVSINILGQSAFSLDGLLCFFIYIQQRDYLFFIRRLII